MLLIPESFRNISKKFCFWRFQSPWPGSGSFRSSSESRIRYLLFLYWPSCLSFCFISSRLCLLISTGLQPLQLQYLHPFGGKVALLWALGTWQMQLFPVLEKAFIHSIQQPFFMTNWFCCICWDDTSGFSATARSKASPWGADFSWSKSTSFCSVSSWPSSLGFDLFPRSLSLSDWLEKSERCCFSASSLIYCYSIYFKK